MNKYPKLIVHWALSHCLKRKIYNNLLLDVYIELFMNAALPFSVDLVFWHAELIQAKSCDQFLV